MKKIIIHNNIKKSLASEEELFTALKANRQTFNQCLREAPLLYFPIKIPKKNGGFRDINMPSQELKLIQRKILDNILLDIKLPSCVYGLSKNKTALDNAKYHSKSDYLLSLDLENFFPSVHFKRIKEIFRNIGLENVSETLCKLTTLNHELPQGAPTSPILANLSLDNLDYRLTKLAESNYLIYSRYFDDICFSGSKRIIGIEKSIHKIITEEGYQTKSSKRMLFVKNDEKEINGILIKDGKLSLKNTTELLNYLKEINEYGFGKLQSDNPTKERLSIMGKIAYLKKVAPEQSLVMEEIFNSIDW